MPSLNYTSLPDVRGTLVKLREAPEVADELIMIHGNGAEGEINAYLAQGGYVIPVASPGEFLRSMARELTCYKILAERMGFADIKKTEWPDIRDRIFKNLEMIRKGELGIVTDEGDEAPRSASMATSSTEDYLPIYSDGLNPLDSIVDPRKGQDDRAERWD